MRSLKQIELESGLAGITALQPHSFDFWTYANIFILDCQSTKGGPGASGRVLPPVTGRSLVRVAVSSHCTGEGKACHWHPSPDPALGTPFRLPVNTSILKLAIKQSVQGETGINQTTEETIDDANTVLRICCIIRYYTGIKSETHYTQSIELNQTTLEGQTVKGIGPLVIHKRRMFLWVKHLARFTILSQNGNKNFTRFPNRLMGPPKHPPKQDSIIPKQLQ